jgi:hypothetical protein
MFKCFEQQMMATKCIKFAKGFTEIPKDTSVTPTDRIATSTCIAR